ncbi:two pore domain potassium channel family protein [Paracoccus aurantiacus]|uniref:Two pore domain potassium channel family protein n=1 Tax=Paracoccus aurantiacus TaxID=2599412 RepID=A0A5C6S9V7_9RHOB|nr:ion channel [Paracoccus aurantiacus]TXB70523.1 two pore domain potassium channel family protein [Paracoccus aurantiacus]
MWFQIALGSVLMMGTVVLAGLTVWLLECLMGRVGGWFRRGRAGVKLMLGVMAMSLWALFTITLAVWLWAFTFLHLGAFGTMEESAYFTLVTFTTLGYGDVVLPQGLRILGGLAAVNGMLNIGILTAILLETIRQLRQQQ